MVFVKIHKTHAQYTKVLDDDGDLIEDNTCLICDVLCTKHSRCSDRYFRIFGHFFRNKILNQDPERNLDNIYEKYEIQLINVCDKCMNKYEEELEDSCCIIFIDDLFTIEYSIRMND
jgi:hypothetical protein